MGALASEVRPAILCVDDDPIFLRALQRSLGRHGYQVEVCTSGERGLQEAAVGHHDVVLLDWLMPGLDGLTTCQMLRRNNPSVGIIMLTAQSTTNNKVTALQAGADDYLTKPCDLPELIARIEALWRRCARSGTFAVSAPPASEPGALAARGPRCKLLRREQILVVYGRRIELGRIETRFFAVLLSRAGRVITREAMCEVLWGDSGEGSQHRLDVLVSRIRSKLGSDALLLQTVSGTGHRLRSSPAGLARAANDS